VSTTTPSSAAREEPATVTIIGHSDLFYWWPVWAFGFLMALLTYLDGSRLVVVPAGTAAEKDRQVQGVDGPRDVLVLPAGQHLPVDETTGTPEQPGPRMARSNGLGATFVTVLLVVLLITNIRMGGVWSLLFLVLVVLVSVLLALLGAWDRIFQALGAADVHITGAGYLCIAGSIFIAWLAVLLFYDRMTYASFGRGQFTIHHALGAGETSFDVQGMMLEKKRDDLFRHWLLGMGSGDLLVRTGGVNARTVELRNVLFVGAKLAKAQQMLKERQVVKA
jgi:hypothetical protein